jgi:hypothetical protein
MAILLVVGRPTAYSPKPTAGRPSLYARLYPQSTVGHPTAGRAQQRLVQPAARRLLQRGTLQASAAVVV